MKKIFAKLKPQLKNKFSQCQFLVLDFDGVLTDNKVYVDGAGKETVRCDRGDGLGLELLKKLTDTKLLIISKEKNKVTEARAKKLKIKCIYGINDKDKILKQEIKKAKINRQNIAYIGNDLNDLSCLQLVGLAIAVNNSHPEIIRVANYKTIKNGGDGAVREVCELILLSKRINYISK